MPHLPVLNAQDGSQNGLSGPDESPACTAAGGVGSDTDCRRNNVQIDPNSGLAVNPEDQCTSIGGYTDGAACFRDGTQVDPETGDELQPNDPNYVPQPEEDQGQQDETAPGQDQQSQDDMAPPDGSSDSGEQDNAPPDTSSEPPLASSSDE